MKDITRTMALLSPILSRISDISKAIQNAGGPVVKITRNPSGIIEVLELAKQSRHPEVQARYQELFASEYHQSLDHLTQLGHRFGKANNQGPNQEFSNERLNQDAKVGANEENRKVSTGVEPKKSRTIKTVYRGRVTYKEVPL